MPDTTNTIARLAIKKMAEEREDPLLVFTMLEGKPELRPGMKVCAYTRKDGSAYNAYLVYFNTTGNGCCFYKECIRKGCKSKIDAELIAEYGQNTATVSCPGIQNSKPSLEINLN